MNLIGRQAMTLELYQRYQTTSQTLRRNTALEWCWRE
jgi:hypothetical protein